MQMRVCNWVPPGSANLSKTVVRCYVVSVSVPERVDLQSYPMAQSSRRVALRFVQMFSNVGNVPMIQGDALKSPDLT
jgi:hypothetical protein